MKKKRNFMLIAAIVFWLIVIGIWMVWSRGEPYLCNDPEYFRALDLSMSSAVGDKGAFPFSGGRSGFVLDEKATPEERLALATLKRRTDMIFRRTSRKDTQEELNEKQYYELLALKMNALRVLGDRLEEGIARSDRKAALVALEQYHNLAQFPVDRKRGDERIAWRVAFLFMFQTGRLLNNFELTTAELELLLKWTDEELALLPNVDFEQRLEAISILRSLKAGIAMLLFRAENHVMATSLVQLTPRWLSGEELRDGWGNELAFSYGSQPVYSSFKDKETVMREGVLRIHSPGKDQILQGSALASGIHSEIDDDPTVLLLIKQ